ncbi:MAG: glycosyltransferase [Paludibacteraceae bacterium]|nr:glycosyltransferase [Paludibacteraceae bacterium]
MTKPKVTISVPVYNTKQYLTTCLDSLINQTLKDIEIIIVDDGSTDGSGEICDEYAKKDNRIKVFHKENGGLASARQVGLDNTTGEYYTVCDSDDWVELDMYEKLYSKIIENDSDMIICDIFYNYPDGIQKILSNSFTCINSKINIIKDAITRKILPTTFNKLYKTSLLREYNINYESGINQGEDKLFFYKQLLNSISICYMPQALYHYRRILNGSSYTNSPTLKSVKQINYIVDWEIKNFDNVIYGKELFISKLNLAFTAIRANISNEEYNKINIKYLSLDKFIRYKILSLKTFLILLSKISYPFSKFIYKKTYKIFYK